MIATKIPISHNLIKKLKSENYENDENFVNCAIKLDFNPDIINSSIKSVIANGTTDQLVRLLGILFEYNDYRPYFEEIVLKLEPKIDQFSLRTMLGIIMNAI